MPKQGLLSLTLIVFTAVTLVVVADTAGKLLTTGGVAPAIVAWSRFFIATLILLPFSGLTLQEFPRLLHWRILLRASFVTGGIFCILTALRTEPMANVFGAFFVGPIVSYILAVLFLGERPSLSRTWLLALGFLGVMLVVKPGFGASSGMIFALAAGTCYGAYLAMTRAVAPDFRPRFLLISQLMIGSILLTPLGLSFDLPSLNLNLIILFLISAFGSALGNYMLVLANKTAEASLIAPLVYSQLISATALGVLVFGDWPGLISLIGLFCIILSGLGSLLVSRVKYL